MQRINRILAFASVSFVLIFIAKINKAGLHTAYFKTLAESEFRNSQDVAPKDLLLSQDFNFAIEDKVELDGFGSDSGPASSSDYLHFIPRKIESHYHTNGIFVSTLHFIQAVAPRAPTA